MPDRHSTSLPVQPKSVGDPARKATAKAQPLLRLTAIDKSFPGCLANDAIDLEVEAGEIHALLGENGAGKSTLVKIIYGVLRPDRGKMTWQGAPLEVSSPAEARRIGIGMVFQHFSLFEAMTVLENIALALPSQDFNQLRNRIKTTAEAYGLALDLERYVYELSMGERQRIEIVRSLLQDPQLLILDEPTSVLTPQETDTLFATLHALTEEGRAVLYISHKLEEVRRLCDRATILRAGRRVDHCLPAHETTQSLAEKMLGRRIDPTDRDLRNAPGEHRLKVSGLTTHSRVPHGINLSAISFAVGKGEILGIAGIAGNGQAELMTAMTGESGAPDSGFIEIMGTDATKLGPLARRALSAVFVPEERLGHAAVGDMNLVENSFLTSPDNNTFCRRGIIDWPAVELFAQSIAEQFDVRTTGVDALATSLSGGNLQKFIVGREILQTPGVLVVSQPTWGVDAGAAADIHHAIRELTNRGSAVLIISQDLDEILTLCDRVAVISQGTLSAAQQVTNVTPEQIGLLMGTRHISSPAEATHAAT